MIELHGLTKCFGTMRAVDDLTVTIEPGRVTALVGPHESGKTVTLRMVLGLISPTSGSATVLGRRYADLPCPLRQVGTLLAPQDAQGGRRAADQLLWVARSNGIPRRRVAEVLSATGLTEIADRRVTALSAGMRQRLGIAATLLGDPDVLIYDGPVTGLDPAGVSWAHALLRGLADSGRTVFVTAHRIEDLAGIADHFLVISAGRLIAEGSADELAHAGGDDRVLVRCDDPTFLAGRLTATGAGVRLGTRGALLVSGLDSAEIHRLTVREGVRLHELTPQRATLEDAYLELIGYEEGAA